MYDLRIFSRVSSQVLEFASDAFSSKGPFIKYGLTGFYMIPYKNLSVMCSVLGAKPLSKVIVLTCTVCFIYA